MRAVRLTWEPMNASAPNTGSRIGKTGPMCPDRRNARCGGSPVRLEIHRAQGVLQVQGTPGRRRGI